MSDGVLTKSWRARLLHKRHVDRLLCFRCGREIYAGDQIHQSNHSVGLHRGHGRIYHLDCFEEMFFEAR